MEEKVQNTDSKTMSHGSGRRFFRKRIYKLSILVVIVIAVGGYLLLHKNNQTQSQKLVSQVSHLQSKSYCSSGLKQLSPEANKLENSGAYSLPSREQALNYLMTCYFAQGNTGKALSYASSLSTLYKKDNESQKQAQLTQTIEYMKSYGH
jgi:hypothetical protein